MQQTIIFNVRKFKYYIDIDIKYMYEIHLLIFVFHIIKIL